MELGKRLFGDSTENWFWLYLLLWIFNSAIRRGVLRKWSECVIFEPLAPLRRFDLYAFQWCDTFIDCDAIGFPTPNSCPDRVYSRCRCAVWSGNLKIGSRHLSHTRPLLTKCSRLHEYALQFCDRIIRQSPLRYSRVGVCRLYYNFNILQSFYFIWKMQTKHNSNSNIHWPAARCQPLMSNKSIRS